MSDKFDAGEMRAKLSELNRKCAQGYPTTYLMQEVYSLAQRALDRVAELEDYWFTHPEYQSLRTQLAAANEKLAEFKRLDGLLLKDRPQLSNPIEDARYLADGLVDKTTTLAVICRGVVVEYDRVVANLPRLLEAAWKAGGKATHEAMDGHRSDYTLPGYDRMSRDLASLTLTNPESEVKE